jgi:tetratricopeptide (TPR) repeat protein
MNKMNELRLAASAMNEVTLALSAELSLCPEFHDEALLWAAFYNNQNGQYEQNTMVSDMLDKPDSISDRYQVLAEASQGRYQKLKSLVESGAPGYVNDAESNLILARSLMRAKQVAVAHEQYQKYLQLKPDDIDVHIEQAYSYLWNDNWKKAQRKFRLIEMQKLTPVQIKTVKAGQEQSDKVKNRKLSEGGLASTEIPLGFERVANSFKSFSRQSLVSGYHTQAYSFDASVMTLNSDDTSTQQTAGEVLISKNFSLTNSVEFYGKAGWLQGVGGNYNLVGVLTKTLNSGIKPLIGFESTPLVKIAPIPKEHTDWSQQSVFAGFRVKDKFEYRLYAMNMTEQGSAAKHSLILEIPIKMDPNSGQLKFKLLAENLATQSYSAYIYSPRDSTVVLPGLVWSVKPDEQSEVKAHIDYGFVSERLNDGATTASSNLANNSSGQLFGFGLNYRTEIDKSLDAELKFQYDRTSAGGSTSYQASQVYIGLIWRLDQEEEVDN